MWQLWSFIVSLNEIKALVQIGSATQQEADEFIRDWYAPTFGDVVVSTVTPLVNVEIKKGNRKNPFIHLFVIMEVGEKWTE